MPDSKAATVKVSRNWLRARNPPWDQNAGPIGSEKTKVVKAGHTTHLFTVTEGQTETLFSQCLEAETETGRQEVKKIRLKNLSEELHIVWHLEPN